MRPYVLSNHDTVIDNDVINCGMERVIHMVCDGAPESSHFELEIAVRSDEYFATLATILDNISDHPELQKIVHNLIYLQQHYKIVKK